MSQALRSSHIYYNYEEVAQLWLETARRMLHFVFDRTSCFIHKISKMVRVLGVIINDKLTAADHVTTLLTSCSSLFYALRILRTHGILAQSLHDVFRATVVAKIL